MITLSLTLLLSYMQLGAIEGEISFMLRKVTREVVALIAFCFLQAHGAIYDSEV